MITNEKIKETIERINKVYNGSVMIIIRAGYFEDKNATWEGFYKTTWTVHCNDKNHYFTRWIELEKWLEGIESNQADELGLEDSVE